jgi:malate dehydrogenase (oxaloacetate-decarboxylating)
MASAVGEAGGSLDTIDLVRLERGKKVRDVTVLAVDEAHIARITQSVSAQDGIEVEHVSDRTLLLHRGGKLEIASKVPLKTRDDLSMAYTPGVARVCRAIADDPERVWSLTTKANAVAIVTDGTAVLGLGDIGPEAALPVMEGKAILFKEFGGIDAWPICLATTDPDEIVRTVIAIAPGFGGINLEDIAAPRCFEIEAQLRDTLEIPVFHDDQHGTAIVVLAALQNALRVVGKRLEEVRIVVTGAALPGQRRPACWRRPEPAKSSVVIAAACSTLAAPASIRSMPPSLQTRTRGGCTAPPTRLSSLLTSTSGSQGPAR